MRFKCIIIEDEGPAIELLKMYLEQMTNFDLLGSFDNAFTAFSFLQDNPVDLIFLDIQMPKMTGLELLRSLRQTPKVIITTAYRDHALEAFELDVIDYLLKPISQDRFLRSISKFHSYCVNTHSATESNSYYDHAYIFLKVEKVQVKVLLKDILFFEGLKDYIKVYTTEKMLVVYERLGYMEEKLPDSHFIRIHKSYLVAMDKIELYTNENARIGKYDIPIGRVYKQHFLNTIGSLDFKNRKE